VRRVVAERPQLVIPAKEYSAVHHSAVEYSAVQYGTVRRLQYSIVQCGAVQYIVLLGNSVVAGTSQLVVPATQYSTVQCSRAQLSTVMCSIVQYSACHRSLSLITAA